MEVVCSTYDYWYDSILLTSSFVMLCDGLFERVIDVMHVAMVSSVLVSVESLHSMSWRLLLHLYVVSTTSSSRAFILYPLALIMPDLWCCGLLCFGSRLLGIIVGCCVFVLSFCSPWLSSRACRAWSTCGVLVSIRVYEFKSLVGLFPGTR
jgi:hypothetical protein